MYELCLHGYSLGLGFNHMSVEPKIRFVVFVLSTDAELNKLLVSVENCVKCLAIKHGRCEPCWHRSPTAIAAPQGTDSSPLTRSSYF